MKSALEKGREAFQVEARELLEELETALLALESDRSNEELIGRIFRAMHTLKGSGGMFGFSNIESFAHHIETALDKVRGGELAVSQELIDMTLLARDQIDRMLTRPDGEESDEEAETVQRLTEAFSVMGSASAVKSESSPAALTKAASSRGFSLYHVYFNPNEEIFLQGTNPLLLVNELAEMGSSAVIARADRLPLWADFNEESCYTAWDVFIETEQDENGIRDVFIFVEDECEISVDKIFESAEALGPDVVNRCAEAYKENGTLSAEELKTLIQPESSADENSVSENGVNAGAAGDKSVSAASLVSNIRVASAKLDRLVDLVGELVIAQARLQQTVLENADTELVLLSEEMERLTNDLRETAMEMRLVPIGTLFSKFKRLVRDLSRAQGKQINLDIVGGDTELDKNVIERLNDPLIHIIRNCIDHGIEPAAKRLFGQKPTEGTIRLSAGHSGAQVKIVIEDDGAGLDTEAIRRKAVAKGMIQDDQKLTDLELHQLVFQPGFSTKSTVTSLSGRGVGMDVVKKNIEALRGIITLESRKGEGTRLTIQLPLTLGIIDGLLTRIGDAHYVFPLSLVEECVELQRNGHKKGGRQLIHLRDQAVPYTRLREHFLIDDPRPDIEQILITDHQGEKYGFVVDEVIGEQQVVIKSLGKMIRNVEGLSGATIMGDGTVALIIDVGQIVQIMLQNENQNNHISS